VCVDRYPEGFSASICCGPSNSITTDSNTGFSVSAYLSDVTDWARALHENDPPPPRVDTLRASESISFADVIGRRMTYPFPSVFSDTFTGTADLFLIDANKAAFR